MTAGVSDTGWWRAGTNFFYHTTYNQVALFNSTTTNSSTIVDYITWVRTGSSWSSMTEITYAVDAGIWPNNTTYFSSYPNAGEGSLTSIGLIIDGGDSNVTSDWQYFATSTPNASNSANNAPTVTASNILITSGYDTFFGGKTYKIRITYSDQQGASDIERMDMRITNNSDSIWAYTIRPSASANATIVTGNAYVVGNITVDTSYSGNDVQCTWTMTFDWDWTEANNYYISGRATDDNPETGNWTDSTVTYTYENDLILAGTLTNNANITNGSWVKASQSVTWSGLTVYYEGTVISPDNTDFDIRLTTSSGNTDQTTGAALNQAVSTRATSGVDYCTATVVNIPTGGSFVSATTQGMTFNVDADNPSITVNAGEDYRVIKSTTGAMYGSLFNIDFSDGTSHIDTAYVWIGANTQTITAYGGASYTTNWAINETVFGGLSSGNNTVNVTAYDSAGNRTNQTITIVKETITINGDTSDWQSDELLESRNNNSFYVAWDDTCFYFAYGGSDGDLANADFFVYLQTSSVTGSDSTYTTINWGGQGTHTLPFGANYAIAVENGNLAEFQRASSGSWTNISNNSIVDSSFYGGWSGTKLTEFRINWNAFGGKPTSLKVVAFHQWENASNVYNSFPTGNTANNQTNVTFTKYYNWTDMTDTVAPSSGVPINNAPTVTIVAPTAGSETTGTVRFSWSYSDADSDAQSMYNIQFSTTNTFATILYQDTQSSSNTYYDSALNNTRGTYYWRVRVYDGQEWSSFTTGDSSFVMIAGNDNNIENAGIAFEPDSTVPSKSYRYMDTSGQTLLNGIMTQNNYCTLTVRSYKNDFTAAYIRVWWDNYDYADGESIYTMTKAFSSGVYDYWSGTIPVHTVRAYCYFRLYVVDGNDTHTVSNGGSGGTEYGSGSDTWYIVDSQSNSSSILDDSYLVIYYPTTGDILITEVMPNEPGTDAGDYRYEYIEIYNNTASTIDLDAYLKVDDDLDYAGSVRLEIINYALNNTGADTDTLLLGPGKYAILIDEDYRAATHIYQIDSSAIVLMSPDGSNLFGSGLTTSEDISLWFNGVLMDTYPAKSPSNDGAAIERVDTSVPSGVPSNWVESKIQRYSATYTYYGTPGEKYDTPALAPTGLSPTNGSGQNTLTPTLSWTHNDNAGSWTTQVKFHIQIDTYGTFATGTNIVDSYVTSTSSSWTVPHNLRRWTKYYWRVRTWSRPDFCDTGAWSSGTDTFYINRFIVDADTEDWYGSTSVDADKNNWNTIKVGIDEQSGTSTTGGKFFWRDAIPISLGGQKYTDGDASTEGNYSGNNASAHDLKYFSMAMDYNNLYFLIELVDLRDDIPALVQIALDVADNTAIDSSIYFHGTGVTSKDVKVTENSKWEYLVQVYNGGDRIYVTTPQSIWQDTNITGSSTYSEHIDNNFFEVAVPFSYIGGSSYYLNRSSSDPLKVSVAVFRANTGSNPAVPSDFNKNLGGSDYNVPQAVDCISDLPYNYNGAYDPQQHELGPNDQTISYNIVTTSSNGNVLSVETVSSGKVLDGNLGDWVTANERMEVSNGDTLWLAFGDENINVALEGFDLSGASHFGVIFDTSANTGCTVGVGGPKFDTSFTPDVYIIVNDGSDGYYYKPQANGTFGNKTSLTSAQFYVKSSDSTVEMAIPRSLLGISNQSSGLKVMAFTSTGSGIYGAWPVTNPTGADSSVLTFIGTYYYDSTVQNAKTNNAIDTNSPPTFVISVKSTPHYDSNSDSSDADTSTWYDSSLLNDSFTIIIEAADGVSSIADSGIELSWKSTTTANNKYVRLGKTASSNSFDIRGDTNGIITVEGWARNNYGLQSYDTIIFGFDNVNPTTPNLLHPSSQSDTTGDLSSVIRFDWSDATDILYGTTTGSGLKRYHIWISTNNSFSDTVFAGWTSGTTSETTYNFSSKSEGIYYWKVKAQDNVLNEGNYTAADTFYFSRRPTLSSWNHSFVSCTVTLNFDTQVNCDNADTTKIYIQKTKTASGDSVAFTGATILTSGYSSVLTIRLQQSTVNTIAGWETASIYLSYDTDFVKNTRGFGCTAVTAANAKLVNNYVTGYDTDIIINELYYYPATGDKEWIELYNKGSNGWKNLDGWVIRYDGTNRHTFTESVIMGPGDYLIISNASGTNDTDLTQGTAGTGIIYKNTSDYMSNTSGDLSLYKSSTINQNTIVDFIAWGASAGEYDDTAVTAGIWTADTYITGVTTQGYTIGRYPNGTETNSPADWTEFMDSTPNSVNEYPSGIGSAQITAPDSGIGLRGDTGQSVTIGITGLGRATIDSVTITIPYLISWTNNASNVYITGAGAGTPSDTTISGAGTEASPYVIKLTNLAITTANTVSITIKDLRYDGGADSSGKAITGQFTFIVKTGVSNKSVSEISSSPSLKVIPRAGEILFSEIYPKGTGTTGEWVEFYNRTNYHLGFNGLVLKASGMLNPFNFSSGDSIQPYSYFLVVDEGYEGQYDTMTSKLNLAQFSSGDGIALYCPASSTAYNTYVLDAVGYGTGSISQSWYYEGDTINVDCGTDSSYERLSEGATDEASHNPTGGNSKDTNNNRNDFYVRGVPEAQGSWSQAEAPAGALPNGSASITPTNYVAVSGAGEWTIVYTCGSVAFTSGVIKVGIPSSWTAPQKSSATSSGYVSVTTSGNGTNSYLGYDCSGNTITVWGVVLSDSSCKVNIKYGYTNNGTNKGAIVNVPSTTGTYTFDVEASIDSSVTTDIRYQPSLKVVNPASWTMTPSIDPQSFKGSEYEVYITVRDSSNNLLYGATIIADSISSPGDSATISEYSSFNNGDGHYKESYVGAGTGDTVYGYTNSSGQFYVTLMTSTDSGLNQFRFYNSVLGETIYKDTTRDPFPVISEIAWDGDDQYEFLEIYNPLSTSVDMTGYHIGDAGGTNTIVTEAQFNGISLPAYGYILIYDDLPNEGASYIAVPDSDYVNTGVVVINVDLGASGKFSDSGESITIYKDGATNTFVDRHYKSTGGWWAGVDNQKKSMERLWITRSGDLSQSWSTSTATHYYQGGASEGKGTPGYANSVFLYNSTINEVDTTVGNTDTDARIYIRLVQNDGRPVVNHKVWLRSSRGTGYDTFIQPYQYFGTTSETGVTYGLVYSTTSGTATIYVDTPAGITDTAVVVFDFDSPSVPMNISSIDTNATNVRFDWSDASDSHSGMRRYRIQIAGNVEFSVLIADSYTANATTSETTITLNDSIYYWRVASQDNVGNVSNWSSYETAIVRYNAPSIKITNPADYDETSVSYTTISGTTKNSNFADSIYLYVKGETQGTAISLSGYNANWSGSVTITGNADVIVAKLIDKFGRTAYDTITLNNWASDTTLKINEIMYNPPVAFGDTKGDWLELYNDTKYATNVKNWKIRIGSGSLFTLTTSDYYIPAYGYLILAADTTTNGLLSATYNYNINDSYLMITGLDLDPTSTTITILNSNGYIVDKITYNASWGAGTSVYGKTLERINPDGGRTDANFDTTTASYGTPGAINSLSMNLSIISDGLAIADTNVSGSYDTIAEFRVILINQNRHPARNHNIKAFTTGSAVFTNSTGSENYGNSYNGATNDSGYIDFYLKNSVAETVYVTASCTEFSLSGDSVYISDSGKIQFIEYNGMDMGFDTSISIESATVSSETFIMEPVFSPDGNNIAYLGRYGGDTYFDLYKMTIANLTKTKLADGEKLKINNMSRITWGYTIGADSYIIVSGTYDATGRVALWAIKPDGTNANSTQADLIAANQRISLEKILNIYDVDLIPNQDTTVVIVQKRYMLVYNTKADTYIYIMKYLTSPSFNSDGKHYAIGQPRLSPNGKHIAFIRYHSWENSATKAFIDNSVDTVLYGEVWVLCDVDKIISGEESPLLAMREGGQDWNDTRLIKLSDSNKLCYNPNWNSTGDVVSWSQDDSGAFNIKRLHKAGYDGSYVYSEFSKADFNVYQRGINTTSKTTTTGILEEKTGDGNQFSRVYSNSDTTAIVEMSGGSMQIKIQKIGNSTQVTANGGILFDNGKTTISVPANEDWAINTILQVTEPTSIPSGDSDAVKMVLTGAAREYYPSGQQFSNFVELYLYYTTTDLTNLGITNNTEQEYQLKIYFYNPTTKSWEKYDGIVEPEDGTDYAGRIRIYTNHFSLYAIGLDRELSDTLSSIIISQDTVIYEKGETISFSISLKDKEGVGLGKQEVYLRSEPSAGITIIQFDTNTTNNNSPLGVVTGYIKIDTNSYEQILLKAVNKNNEQIISDTKVVKIIRIKTLIDKSKSEIFASKNVVKTFDNDSVIITIKFKDENNQFIKGISGRIIVANSDGSEIIEPAGIQQSDENGEIICIIRSTKAGTKIIKLIDAEENDLLSDTIVIEFIDEIKVVNDTNSLISISKSVCIADGNDSAEITFILRNENNEIVKGAAGKITIVNISSEDTIIPADIQIVDNNGEIKASISSTKAGKKEVKLVNSENVEIMKKSVELTFLEVDKTPPVIVKFYVENGGIEKVKNHIKSGDTVVDIYCYVKDDIATGYLRLKADLSSITGRSIDKAVEPDNYDGIAGIAYWRNVSINNKELLEGDTILIKVEVADFFNTSAKETIIKFTGNYKFIDVNTISDTIIEIDAGDTIGKGKLIISKTSLKTPETIIMNLKNNNDTRVKEIGDTTGWAFVVQINSFNKTRKAINLKKVISNYRTAQGTIRTDGIEYAQYELNIALVHTEYDSQILLEHNDEFVNYPPIEIEVEYPATMDDIEARKLRFYYLSEDLRWFDEQPTEAPDLVNKKIRARLTRFSIYVLGTPIYSDLSHFNVYPNPWTPYSIRDGIYFDNIPAGTNLRIYNIAGELIDEQFNLPGGTAKWDLRNKSGEKVASGIYLYVIETATERRTGKILVIK